MEHIGKDVHAEIVDKDGNEVTSRSHYRDEGNHLNVEPSEDDLVLAGHLLITLSLNITLFDLAK